MKKNDLLKSFIIFLTLSGLVLVMLTETIYSLAQSEDSLLLKSELRTKSLLEGFDYFEGKVVFEEKEFFIRGLIINPKKYQIAVAGLNPETYSGYTLGGFQARSNALAVITGGFRSSQNLPLGLVIEDGKIFNRLTTKPTVITGIVAVRDKKVEIIHYREYDPSIEYDYALQSGPLIIKKGGINGIHKSEKETKYPFSRSFIALQRNGNVVLAITGGVHLYDLAEFLRDTSEQGLNCDVALNLEGGGGEGLIVNAGSMNETFRNVRVRRPNAIIVTRLSISQKEF